jgi:hypothetical protein
LHTNPDDVIPVLAFARRKAMPPVVYLDHADQLFWLGVSITDVLASLRESGARLAQARRGIEASRISLLPIALSPFQRTLSRPQAKHNLGLAADDVLILSVARPHKYLPIGELSLAEAVLPALASRQRAVMLAIGPNHDDLWSSASGRVQGRIRALGMREDTEVFYQAADIYVDSFPIVSITSLLEAGSYGTPLVSLCPHEQGSVLCADTPALARCLIQASTLPAYRDVLGGLMDSLESRLSLGEQTQRAIVESHSGSGWLAALESLYGRAQASTAAELPPGQVEQPRADDLDRLLPRLFAGEPDLESVTQFNLRLLPFDLRLRVWFDMLKGRQRPPLGRLLPEWFGTRLERWFYPDGSDLFGKSSRLPFGRNPQATPSAER